jgi:hypothetical protein
MSMFYFDEKMDIINEMLPSIKVAICGCSLIADLGYFVLNVHVNFGINKTITNLQCSPGCKADNYTSSFLFTTP